MARKTERMLAELAEMCRQSARHMRDRAARGVSAQDAARLLRAAAEADREAEKSLRVVAAMASERRRREFGLGSLRHACPPTATRH